MTKGSKNPNRFWENFWENVTLFLNLAYRQSAGGKISTIGLCLLGLTWSSNFELSLGPNLSDYIGGRISPADMPDWLVWGGTSLSTILIIVGCVMVYQTWYNEQKLRTRRRVIGIEIRGLANTLDTGLIEAIPSKFIGQRREILLDIRSQVSANTQDKLNEALKHISTLKIYLATEKAGLARNDLKIFAGGVAPVPFLFLTGMLLDDEGQVNILDWDRVNQKWNSLASENGINYFLPFSYPKNLENEVVVAVSLSYQIQTESIKKTWPSLPVVSLGLSKPLPNKIWSDRQQAELSKEFTDTIAQLLNKGIHRIHLILAASSSFSIRLGRTYDVRNFPEILVYQYEKSQEIPYPWAIQMPTHGIDEAKLYCTRFK